MIKRMSAMISVLEKDGNGKEDKKDEVKNKKRHMHNYF